MGPHEVRSSAHYRRGLLVFTNRSFYRFDEPFGLRCRECPPENFCPSGPVWAKHYFYSNVGEIYRGCDGAGFSLRYYKDAMRTLTLREDYIVYASGVLDRLIEV